MVPLVDNLSISIDGLPGGHLRFYDHVLAQWQSGLCWMYLILQIRLTTMH